MDQDGFKHKVIKNIPGSSSERRKKELEMKYFQSYFKDDSLSDEEYKEKASAWYFVAMEHDKVAFTWIVSEWINRIKAGQIFPIEIQIRMQRKLVDPVEQQLIHPEWLGFENNVILNRFINSNSIFN